MGTDLYEVTATKVRGTVVTLDVREVYQDAGMWADPSFALMILHEATKRGDPLDEEVGFEETLDSKWMTSFARGFIAGVRYAKPPAKAKGYTRATLEVTVTDPAWIAHLAPKRTWSSRAFCVVSTYAACKPILPGGGEEQGAASSDDGLMVAPMSIWAFDDPRGLPSTVLVPAYGSGAYQMVDEVKGPFDEKRLAPFAFQPVRVHGDGDTRDGVLVPRKERYYVVSIGRGGHGSYGNGYHTLEKLGRLALKPKARLGDKLEYRYVVESAGSRIVAMRARGAVAEIDIATSPDGRVPEIKSASDVLRIIAAPLLDYTGGVANGRSPLGKALLAECKPDDITGDSMFDQFGAGYVKAFELAKPKRRKVPALETMPLTAVRAWFQVPSPLATLKVTMTDPAWLAHLAKAKPPYVVERYALPRATKRPPKRAS